jgi:hypothetical protein
MPREPAPEILDPEAADPANRRQWPRYAILKPESFTVTAKGRIGTGTCAIEDISLGGARLRMEGPVPGNLEIRIEHPRLGHAIARRCWKSKEHFGVTFDLSEPSLAFIAGCMAEGVEVARAEPAA